MEATERPEVREQRIARRESIIRWIPAVTAVLLVLVLAGVYDVRSNQDEATSSEVAQAEQVSQENQQILEEVQHAVSAVEGGVDAVESGYACLVALLYVPPEQRPSIDPVAFERTCGLSRAQVEYLLVALDS